MLLNSNFHYHIHKRSPLASALVQINPSHIFRHLLQITFNTIYSLSLPFLSLFFKFSHQRFLCTVFITCLLHNLSISPPVIPGKVKFKKKLWTYSSWSFLQHLTTAFVISPHIFLSTLFSDTPSFPTSFTW
jgi:hypothetical protein